SRSATVTPTIAYRTCRSKYQKLLPPYPWAAETDPAERTITSPTAVRNPAEENRSARSTRARRAASFPEGRRSAGTSRRAGRATRAVRRDPAAVRRSAIDRRPSDDRSRRRHEPVAALRVIAELIPARARRRQQDHARARRHPERDPGRLLDRSGAAHLHQR